MPGLLCAPVSPTGGRPQKAGVSGGFRWGKGSPDLHTALSDPSQQMRTVRWAPTIPFPLSATCLSGA